jgi:hypothetical protein
MALVRPKTNGRVAVTSTRIRTVRVDEGAGGDKSGDMGSDAGGDESADEG